MLHRDAAELLLQLLVDDGLVTAFVSALQARGVAIDTDALADPDGETPFEELEAFLPNARAFPSAPAARRAGDPFGAAEAAAVALLDRNVPSAFVPPLAVLISMDRVKGRFPDD